MVTSQSTVAPIWFVADMTLAAADAGMSYSKFRVHTTGNRGPKGSALN